MKPVALSFCFAAVAILPVFAESDLETRIDSILAKLSLREQAHLIHAVDGFDMGGMPEIGLETFQVLDGPNGPRAEDKATTFFPCGIAYAATWDKDLVRRLGRALGEETRGVYTSEEKIGRMLLGPGVNIARTPCGARAFEYSGEDPVLAGRIASAYILGLQDVGVAPCLKHYVLNDQEFRRHDISVECPERALREIYVRPFEIAVREAKPWAVMNSYNRIDGVYASHNWRLNRMLMAAGFDGAFISDWGGYINDIRSIDGGSTIESAAAANPVRDAQEAEWVERGVLDEAKFTDAVRRALRLYLRVGAFDGATPAEKSRQAAFEKSVRSPEHRALAYEVAAKSAVLVKNDGFLPRKADTLRKIVIAGPNADQCHSMIDGADRFCRGGSGGIMTDREITPLAGFVERFGRDRVVFAPGFRFEEPRKRSFPDMEEADPVEAAREADLVVFCGGVDHKTDHEVDQMGDGDMFDKKSLALRGPQAELINRIAAVNPNVVVVLTTGGQLSVEEFEANVKAILVTWYAGGENGLVLADLVTGVLNPSGKLPYTFGRRLSDWTPFRPEFNHGGEAWPGTFTSKDGRSLACPRIVYHEGIWVGYRGFDRFGVEPRYPFGFGLSYTSFDMVAEPQVKDARTVSVRVTNTGSRAGREIVQCYVTKPAVPGVEMPLKELVDFAAVELAAGETKAVSFTVTDEMIKYWSETENSWCVASGTYKVSVGDSAARLPAVFSFNRE